MPSKKIALLITVYNDQDGFEKTIRSITGDDKDLVDIIVVDDGSEPAVQLDTLKDHDTKLIRLTLNKGVQYASNAGMEYILEKKYAYTARLDAGDLILAGRFKKQLDFMEKNPEYGVVGSWYQMITREGKKLGVVKLPVENDMLKKAMYLNSSIQHPACMFRNDIIRKIGMYDTFYSAALDYDLFMRIMKISKGHNLPEPLIYYEVMNTNAISFKKRSRQICYRMHIQLRNFNLLEKNCYLGLLQTIIMLMLPYKVSHWIKEKLKPNWQQ